MATVEKQLKTPIYIRNAVKRYQEKNKDKLKVWIDNNNLKRKQKRIEAKLAQSNNISNDISTTIENTIENNEQGHLHIQSISQIESIDNHESISEILETQPTDQTIIKKRGRKPKVAKQEIANITNTIDSLILNKI